MHHSTQGWTGPIAAFAALLALSGCTIDGPAVEIEGKDVSAIFLHTSDMHSRLLPYTMDVLTMDKNLGMEQKYAPFGGMTRLSAFLKQERRNHPRVAYVDTGDVFQGAPIFNAFGGEIEFKAMTQLRVDAFTIGNHEFDTGAHALVKKAITFANFPMLGGNYSMQDWRKAGITPNGRIAIPYTIVNLTGLRVAVIGLASMGGSYGGNLKGLVPLENKKVVQDYVDFLRPLVDLVAVASHVGYHDDRWIISRTEGIDLYFGGHLHIALNPPEVIKDCDVSKLERERDLYKCDTPEKLKASAASCASKNGCEKLTGASEKATCLQKCDAQAKTDCIREAEVRNYPKKLEELEHDISFLKKRKCHPRDVLLVHSGAFLKYIGKLEVNLRQCHRLEQQDVCIRRDAAGKCLETRKRSCRGNKTGSNDWEVMAHKYTLTPVDSRLPDDPQMLQLLEPYTLELNRQQKLTQVLAYTAERVQRFATYTDSSDEGGGLKAGSADKGDSPLGNLVCDAMAKRAQVWADFAVTNSLGMRSDIVSGPVDAEQMNNVFPFENSITVMYLSGFEVQEMMDFIAQRSASRGCQPQAQVSGINATLNCKGCTGNGGNSCVRQTYDGEACAQRVVIGGSGRPCSSDKDCQRDLDGSVTGTVNKLTGEICGTQDHPDTVNKAGKKRCWMPIACNRSYRLATNDYVAHGGSGFQVLARNTTQKNLKIPLRDSATDWIVNMPGCSRIPQSFDDRVKNRPPRDVITEVLDKALPTLNPPGQPQSGQAWLKLMEQLAVDGEWSKADTQFKSMVAALKSAKSAITDGTDPKRKGLINYLACIDETPDSKTGKCLGLPCVQKALCKTYKVNDQAKCEALSRIRGALRCITVPCISAKQDGRLNLIKDDGAGTVNPSDPFPD